MFCLTLWLVRDDRQLNAYTYTFGLVGVVLLLLPIVPGIGQEINGARLGADIGPVTFQPAEFGKIFIVVFLAAYLTDKQELLATGSARFGFPASRTSVRCSSHGGPRSRCSSSNATWAPRCCSSACSS